MTFRLAIIVGLSAMLFVSAAPAQQKLEVFGGYQYARPDGGPTLNGWNTALTGNFTRNFGITGDFSGTYGGGGSMYTFAFGRGVLLGAALRTCTFWRSAPGTKRIYHHGFRHDARWWTRCGTPEDTVGRSAGRLADHS